MSTPDLEQVRVGRAGCPSDFDLDRLHTGELMGEAAATLFEHLDGCDHCPARMAMRESKFAIAPAVDPRRIMAGVRRRLDEAPQPIVERARLWWTRWIAGLALAGAAAMVFVVLRTGPGPDDVPKIRFKGDLALELHQRQGQGSVVIEPGSVVRPGTELKFVVTLPETGRVKIIGEEANGTLYDAWPLDGQVSRRGAGRNALPGAVALDDAPGRETFHLVLCPPEVEQIRCGGAPLVCPPGCKSTAVAVTKGAR